MQKLLLVVVAVLILAGCAALLLWRADDGAAGGLSPAATVTKRPASVALSDFEQAQIADTEADSRDTLDVAPTSVTEPEDAEATPVGPDVLLRGHLIGPDGVVLAGTEFRLYVDPYALIASPPSEAAEKWRRGVPGRLPMTGLRPDGSLSPPYPPGYRTSLQTDELGRFESQLPGEARELGVRLHFETGNWRSGAKAIVELTDLSTADPNGKELGDIRLRPVEGQLIAAGVVQLPDGRPAPGAAVQLMGARWYEEGGERRIGRGGLMTVVCDERGAFEARGRLYEGEAAEGLYLYARAAGFSVGESGAQRIGATGVVLVLGVASGFEGRVDIGLDEPLPPGLEVLLLTQSEPGVSPLRGRRTRAVVQPDGTFRFDTLAPQLYALRFELRRKPLPFPELEFLDLDLRAEETRLDPRFQPIDLSAYLAVYDLSIESAEGRKLEPVVVKSGKLIENSSTTPWPVQVHWVGKFEESAKWLDLSPPLRIEVEEPSHAPWFVDVYERGQEITARLASPAVLEVRIAGGLPTLEPGVSLHVRHYPWGANETFRPDGTVSMRIDRETQQYLLKGNGFELQLMSAGGAAGPELRTLEPRIGPRVLGPAEGTIEWTIELPPELLPILAGER